MRPDLAGEAALARPGANLRALLDRLLPFPERQRLVGLPELEALSRRYAPTPTEAMRDA